MNGRVIPWLALLLAAGSPLQLRGQLSPAISYDAIAHREARAEPSLPGVGAAGSSFFDPVFSSQLWRVTDGSTRPGLPNRSYRTPSGTHQNAWSADGAYFYVVSTDGTIVPYAFDAAAERARRIEGGSTDEGGLVLRFYTEPHFSYTTPGVIYGSFSGSGATLRTLDYYDFARRDYDRILDLDLIAPGLTGTYIGGIGSSGGTVERLFAFFGGAAQGQHYLLVVLDRANPANRRLLNTRDARLDGRAVDMHVTGFRIHAAAMDRSGRYVMIYPVGAKPVQSLLWDTETDLFTPLDSNAHLNGGHDAYGYGVRVNNASGGAGDAYDAAQWQRRELSRPQTPTALISPLNTPKSVHLADHSSWHNARPDVLTPFITALYRYGANDVPWRAWDDEIVAVEAGVRESGATVWRFAHHRSNVAHDDDASRTYFWYTPRPNVSPDGRWVLFTSNWEKQLGLDPRGEAGGRHRQDVFLLKLRATDAEAPKAEPVRITTTALPAGRRNSRYSTTLHATGGSGALTWRVDSGSLPPGLQLDPASGAIAGTCRSSGRWTFTAAVSDHASSDRRTFSLTIRR